MVEFFPSLEWNNESIIVIALSLATLFGIGYWVNRISKKTIFDEFGFSK